MEVLICAVHSQASCVRGAISNGARRVSIWFTEEVASQP